MSAPSDTEPSGGEFLLDNGMFWCELCERPRRPANTNGDRRYSCGARCAQPDTPATPVEQAAMLGALVRAYAVLYGVGRSDVVFQAPDPLIVDHTDSLPASRSERRRWERCDVTDRRAVLRVAYTRIDIDRDGVIHRNWRHRADAT
ncbi:MAG: hypothetical protein ACRDTQ_13340 [Micromonosporaceae bacterium]